ncbi:O-antigen ligase family protein [Halomonas sp. GD1P12]|uniref:O-antigen ligase family protein n=1 Tax=Halomonas sp. GD1P12 TaxID=2982691 RepID=UPI0021E3D0B0|nr:O-antigen ligase family protein [Halomonas sp. GD1P12]UYF99259.1 O-antigen ligase family protein [Halomonas sp. GD1P12]
MCLKLMMLRNTSLIFFGTSFLIAAPLLLPNGGWLALGALAVLGGFELVSGRFKKATRLARYLVLLPIFCAAATLLACAVQGPQTWQDEWPRLLVLLLSVLTVCALPRLYVSAANVFVAFAVTGAAVGAWALWQFAGQGVERASGQAPFHAILFGNFSLAAGVVCLAGLPWAWQQPKRWGWVMLVAAGALGGLDASLLSGTRGGWLALPLTVWMLYRAYGRKWPLRLRGGISVVIAVLVIGLYSLPQTGVQQRVNSAMSESLDYLNGEAHGSIGVRLELYRVTLQLIAERPWSGYRLQEYRNVLKTLNEQGRVSSGVTEHWHAHNDILNAWLRYGALGGLATLLLYVAPLWFFARRLHGGCPDRDPLALAGCLLALLFFDFGLSYAFFAYPIVLAAYWVWLVVCVAAVVNRHAHSKEPFKTSLKTTAE